MSHGRDFTRFDACAGAFLEPDGGPVENDPCDVGACENGSLYRVPWPKFGGDLAYCSFHLARYRHELPTASVRAQTVVDDRVQGVG